MLSSNFTSSVAIHAILTRWISSEWKSTIDAPERGQAFGQASKRHLSDLAFDSEAVAECHKVDRYGRRVCGVAVAGVDVCLDQLRAGWAWLFTRYAHELPVSRRAAYVDAERGACDERRGLWGAPPRWHRDAGCHGARGCDERLMGSRRGVGRVPALRGRAVVLRIEPLTSPASLP